MDKTKLSVEAEALFREIFENFNNQHISKSIWSGDNEIKIFLILSSKMINLSENPKKNITHFNELILKGFLTLIEKNEKSEMYQVTKTPDDIFPYSNKLI